MKKTGIAMIVAVTLVSLIILARAKTVSVYDETYEEINMVGKYELSVAVGANVYGYCQGNLPFDIYCENCNDPVRLPGDNGGRITATDRNGLLLGWGGNSSSSMLSKPSSNAKVVKAYLMQEAEIQSDRENVLADYPMTLKGPKGGTIKPNVNKVFVSDRSLNHIGVTYTDVTSFVQKQGFGTYEGWDLPFIPKEKNHYADNYSSWRLIVICEDANLPIRMLRMKMGSGSTTGKTITLTLDGDGFYTKSSGNVTGQIIIAGGGGDPDASSSYVNYQPSPNSPVTRLSTGKSGEMNKVDGFMQSIVTQNGVIRSDVKTLGYRPSDHLPMQNTDLIFMDVNSTQSNAQNGHNAYFVNNSNQITLSAVTLNGYRGNLELFGILADIDAATYTSSMSHTGKLYQNADITMKAHIANNTQVNKPNLGVSGGYAEINVDSNITLDTSNITAVYTHNGVKTTLSSSMITVSGNKIKVIFGANTNGKSYRGDALDVTFHGSTKKEKLTLNNQITMYAPNWIDETGVAHAFGTLTMMTSAKDAMTIAYNNPPVITTKNKEFYENEYTTEQWKSQLRMKEISAADKEDGNITNKIKVISDDVNPSKPGTYTVKYQVTDAYGKTDTKTATVKVKYNNPPVITTMDKEFYENEYTVEQWKSQLRMQGITANDQEDGNITSKIRVISDDVKPTNYGLYFVKYQVIDSFGKTDNKTAMVNVKYNHPPVITAEAKTFYENELTPEAWQEEVMKEVTAIDQEDGNITNKIKVIKDNVDPSTPGCYEVTYEVTDSLGKTSQKTIDVTIWENWQPVLQIFAGNHRFIEGEYSQKEWEEQIRMIGVSAHDREDADLTDHVIVTKDTTNALQHGQYEVTYQVTDRWGKSAEKTVKVIVEENKAPEIFAGDKYFTTDDPITEADLLKNVTAIDDRDGDISDKVKIIDSTVKAGTVGTYEVTYQATDRFGKSSVKTVNVYIREKGNTPTPPTPPIPDDVNALSLWNGRQFAELTLTKEMENSLFDQGAYKDVVFGVYTAEDIIYQNDVVLTKDSLVGIGKVDEDKKIHVMLYHAGKYYLKELSTNGRYVLDDTKYYFEYK